MQKFTNWLRDHLPTNETGSKQDLSSIGAKIFGRERRVGDRRAFKAKAATQSQKTDAAGENALIRNRFVREETNTQDKLSILDDSLIDSGEAGGIDPYNTGRFDRSKNWDNRFRK